MKANRKRYINMNCDIRGMELTKAYKFRIYPDTKRQEEIDESISLAQKLYNKLLEKSINGKISRQTFNKYLHEILLENPEYHALYSQTRQDIRDRLIKTYQNFFRRCKEGKGKKGFPKSKPFDKYKSITYPQDNGSFSIERIKGFNRLRVSRIGTMKIELHRQIEGKIKTLTIAKEGKEYYAIFSVAIKRDEPQKAQDTNPVGIDLGLISFNAMSDGRKVEKPKFFKKEEKRIALWQRRVAKKKKGSNNRKKAKLHLQHEWNKVTRQSEDFAQKLSHDLVSAGYTSFAVEDLRIQNMVKNHHLAQSISNACWGGFLKFLTYKAGENGLPIMKVNPQNTSKTCSNCGNILEMPLSKRMFNCDRCGLQLDRDINASINILNRAMVGQTKSHAWGDSASTMQKAWRAESLNQEHTLQQAEEAHTL